MDLFLEENTVEVYVNGLKTEFDSYSVKFEDDTSVGNIIFSSEGIYCVTPKNKNLITSNFFNHLDDTITFFCKKYKEKYKNKNFDKINLYIEGELISEISV